MTGTTLVESSEEKATTLTQEGTQHSLGSGSSMTERMFAKLPTTEDAGKVVVVGGAGGSSSLDAFLRAETNWSKVKAFRAFETDQYYTTSLPEQFVTNDGADGNPRCWKKLRDISDSKSKFDYDVVVCGGTLGIFFATYELAIKRTCRMCSRGREATGAGTRMEY
jgi:hypothetical protein